MKKRALTAMLLLGMFFHSFSQSAQKTYCNPMNLDYGYTPIPNFSEATANLNLLKTSLFYAEKVIREMPGSSGKFPAMLMLTIFILVLHRISCTTALWFTMPTITGLKRWTKIFHIILLSKPLTKNGASTRTPILKSELIISSNE